MGILEAVHWRSVNRRTRCEVRNREHHCPPVSLFRWWARRPNALICALLEASDLDDNRLISDPFSGGGTVALEAAKKGLRVYAQDLHPWAVWGLGTCFDGLDAPTLQKGINAFLEELEPNANALYQTTCPKHGTGTIAHVFWVRECICDKCSKSIYLFPYSLITLSSRSPSEQCGFFGCHACGAVAERKVDTSRRRCVACGTRLKADREPNFSRRVITCPHCSHDVPSDQAWSEGVHWRPVLTQCVCEVAGTKHLHLLVPSPDRLRSAAPSAFRIPALLRELIPLGRETEVLRRTGFRRWCDLYPRRQLELLTTAAKVAAGLSVDTRTKNRLQLAIVGAAEMAGYLCRWDRFHPKAFEALANHHFSALGLAVETNLLAPRGRGTIRRRLLASVKAARWIESNSRKCVVKMHGGHCVRQDEPESITLVCGTSAHQLLPRRCVDLVITDPPYFDAVQYGELAALFLTWAKLVKPQAKTWTPNLKFEAVPNATRGADWEDYQSKLCTILTETARTLSRRASVVITYHSTDFRGWASLGTAIHAAGLQIVSMAVATSENGTDHPKRGKLAFTQDLVLECRRRRKTHTDAMVVTPPRTPAARELIAAGRALALHGRDGAETMARAFEESVSRVKYRRIGVTGILKRANNHAE